MIKKTIVAAFLLLGLIFPIAKSFAVVPALLLFVAPAAESTFVPWAAGVGAAAVAALAGWIMLQDPEKPQQKPITIQLDPNKPLITPTGWTSPTQPPASTPHDNTQEVGCQASAGPGESSAPIFMGSTTDASSACNAACAYGGGTYEGSGIYCSGPPSPTGYSWRINVLSRDKPCPTGYTQNNNTCILSEPEQVKKPPKGKDEIKRDGNVFARDPQQDPADNNPKVEVNGNKISYIADNGEKVEIQLSGSASGGATVTHSIPDTSTGTTKVNTTALSNTGATTGVNQQTYQGTGTQQSSTPSTGTTFPNDYAKAGEAQAAANSTNAKLDTLHGDLTSTANPADGNGTEPTFADATGTAFNALNAWSVPAHISTCPTGTFTAFNQTFTLDAQCTVMEQVKTPLNLAAIVGWLVLALFIVLRA